MRLFLLIVSFSDFILLVLFLVGFVVERPMPSLDSGDEINFVEGRIPSFDITINSSAVVFHLVAPVIVKLNCDILITVLLERLPSKLLQTRNIQSFSCCYPFGWVQL